MLGLPVWITTTATIGRIHITVLLGLLLLIVGIVGTVRNYRNRYPKILSRTIIGCLVLIIIYPFMTEKAMFLIKYNSSGIHSLDYTKKDSQCSYTTNSNQVTATCSFTLYNYGIENEVTLKPIIGFDPEIKFYEETVQIAPHSKVQVRSEFYGEQEDGVERSGGGNGIGIGLELQVDGQRRRIE